MHIPQRGRQPPSPIRKLVPIAKKAKAEGALRTDTQRGFAELHAAMAKCHRSVGYMIAPGDGFYATQGPGLGEVRIAYVLDVDRLQRAMRCRHEGLEAFRRQINA